MLPTNILSCLKLTVSTIYIIFLKHFTHIFRRSSCFMLFSFLQSKWLHDPHACRTVRYIKCSKLLFILIVILSSALFFPSYPIGFLLLTPLLFSRNAFALLLPGIGPPILPDDGLFLTWHFSLFSSLFNRMKRSKRRTYDPEKASLFIIPYDLGLDGYLDAKTCRNTRR